MLDASYGHAANFRPGRALASDEHEETKVTERSPKLKVRVGYIVRYMVVNFHGLNLWLLFLSENK